MYKELFEKAQNYIANNEDLELVEIIESSVAGTPRKEGAFMFVDKNGKSFGTVGGGKVEYLATLHAKELLSNKANDVKRYNLSQKEAENIGMVCGGDSTMRFTYLTNNVESKNKIQEIENQNKSINTVYIFGCGHVGMELAKLINYVGFDYIVWDNRKEFATKERFKDAKKIICEEMTDILNKVNITENDMVVIMTSGHASDYEVEKQILKSKACYIGVIGSKNKNKVIREKLLSDGYSETELNRVCVPIGLSIAAETPEEIAISIVSELILFKAMLENRKKAMEDNVLADIYKEKLKKCER